MSSKSCTEMFKERDGSRPTVECSIGKHYLIKSVNQLTNINDIIRILSHSNIKAVKVVESVQLIASFLML